VRIAHFVILFSSPEIPQTKLVIVVSIAITMNSALMIRWPVRIRKITQVWSVINILTISTRITEIGENIRNCLFDLAVSIKFLFVRFELC
jgi:hypothetical protein